LKTVSAAIVVRHLTQEQRHVNPPTHILTAVDFSEPARAAFDHALALSRRHGAELTVVHAVPDGRAFEWYARERIRMIGALRQTAAAAGIRFNVSVQHGDPAGVILLHARTIRPDVIVLGTHRRTGFDRFRFRSVAETVALRATSPVLIVPSSHGRLTAESLLSFNSILVAVDFSAGSLSAVERALSFANTTSRVTLVHVVPSIPLASGSGYAFPLSGPESQGSFARAAWRRLQGTVSTEARNERTVHARVVTGAPAREIARVATDVNADLILVGVTARGAFTRRMFGSTAARVIRTAAHPVLAVPEITDPAAMSSTNVSQPAIAA
jgi:nucleotide-binding universal stress UspA family protein